MTKRFTPAVAALVFCGLFASVPLSADTITWIGPTFPVIGDAAVYDIFRIQLTRPSNTDPNWLLTVETNYGAPLPGSPDVIPSFMYGNGVFYTMSDFLFDDNNVQFGIAFTAHDGFTPGNLYHSNGFLTSGQVMGQGVSARPNMPVEIAPGALQIGTGTLSAAQTGDGVNTGKFTITVSFNAPANFLPGNDFTSTMSSYVCANGIIVGPPPPVPEPATALLVAPVLLVLVFRRRVLALAGTRK